MRTGLPGFLLGDDEHSKTGQVQKALSDHGGGRLHGLRDLRESLPDGRNSNVGGGRLVIRVKIIPPPGSDRSKLDERGWVELPDGATLRDALRVARCSPAVAKLLLASVNGERVPFSTRLSDGDVVGFFLLCTGG